MVLLPVVSLFSDRRMLVPALIVACLSPCLAPLAARAESGAYVPYSGIITGTDGTNPVTVSITNETAASLGCQAALAHWYSSDLGRIAPGAAVAWTLFHDPDTGVLNLMNATDDRMPVEALWCSSDDHRARIALPMESGQTGSTFHVTCRTPGGVGLRCEATGG